MNTYLITGAGPVGSTIALQLAEAGHAVRLLTRSGSGPEHSGITRIVGDASEPAALLRHSDGVKAIFHCIHGDAYSAKSWQAQLPRAEQAVMDTALARNVVVVFPESLYSYSHPETVMTEDSERAANGGKRGIRVALLAARKAHPASTISMVASDFFGPRALGAHMGDRAILRILAGKKVQVFGSLDQPHSFTYVPDLAAAMIAAAALPAAADRVLHAPTGPALTQRQMLSTLTTAAGVSPVKPGTLPGWLIHLTALLMPSMKEIVEMEYQFTAPFVMDSRASEDLLGLRPTPLETAARETITWWKQRAAS